MSQWARQAAGFLFVALVFATPLSIAAIEILFWPLFIAWIVGWVIPGSSFETFRKGHPARTTLLWLLLYVALCGLSIFYSRFQKTSLEGFVGKTFQYFLFFLIALDVSSDPKILDRSIRALLCAAGVVVAHSLLQGWAIFRSTYKAMVPDPILGRTLEYSRMVGPYKNPNDLATYLMVTLLVVISLLLNPHQKSSLTKKILAVLLAGCLLWIHPRGALLGFLAGMALFLVVNWQRKRVLVGLVGAMLACLGFYLLLSPSSFKALLTFSDVSSHERLFMWDTGWKMFVSQPVFGHGINTFMSNYQSYAPDHSALPAYAHNCFLQTMAEIGLVGFVAFLGFLVSLGKLCWRGITASPSTSAVLAGLTAGLCGFLVQSFFDTNLYVVRQAVLFWTLAGMATALSVQSLRAAPSP